MVVLTVLSLRGNTIEDYAFKVFNSNKLGQEKVDNWILIVASKLDRKVRIEVGDGLTPIITDAFSKRIIEQQIVPNFKENNFFKGIDTATSTIKSLIDNPEYRDEFNSLIEDDKMPLWGKVLLGLIAVLFFGSFIAVGSFFFYKAYKHLIELFRALLSAKISVVLFPFVLILNLLGVGLSLPFILLPLVFVFAFLSEVGQMKGIKNTFNQVVDSPYFNVLTLVVLVLFFGVVLPGIIAYITKSKVKKQPIKFSLFKNSKEYSFKSFSSGKSSSGGYSSSSSSYSSSSSSFSGGGGSSSGGGASGSW